MIFFPFCLSFCNLHQQHALRAMMMESLHTGVRSEKDPHCSDLQCLPLTLCIRIHDLTHSYVVIQLALLAWLREDYGMDAAYIL